ncbi:MAG: UPF0149 family protein [Acidovorax sp.]|nr:UPF0149 family protein [Acidovorax sp.]
MTDDIEIIYSPLTQTYSADGHTLSIQIYRSPNTPWVLEVVDERGTSTVWGDPFDTDKAALEAAFLEIEQQGIHHFVTHAQQAAKDAEPALLRKLAQGKQSLPPFDIDQMMVPLSAEELLELHQFLLDLDVEESMTMDMLDGFLHALAIGPETVMPGQWLPKVWGPGSGGMPPTDDVEQANHLLGLVMRYFNGIIFGFEQRPPVVEPCWSTVQYDAPGKFEDAEMWAFGFSEGVKLSQAAWQPLLTDPQSARWYRPIGLLSDDDFSPDQAALTRTPEQRQALAREIKNGLLQIHAFWLPLRHAVAERQQAQRISTKVGRNEPCPCGSGKKFKKCCGAPSELH